MFGKNREIFDELYQSSDDTVKCKLGSAQNEACESLVQRNVLLYKDTDVLTKESIYTWHEPALKYCYYSATCGHFQWRPFVCECFCWIV